MIHPACQVTQQIQLPLSKFGICATIACEYNVCGYIDYALATFDVEYNKGKCNTEPYKTLK